MKPMVIGGPSMLPDPSRPYLVVVKTLCLSGERSMLSPRAITSKLRTSPLLRHVGQTCSIPRTQNRNQAVNLLTRYDEMLCHQVVSTFDHPATSAREWTETLWFSVHDTTGAFHLVSGFGSYPKYGF